MPKFTQKHNKALERIAAKTASIMPFLGDSPAQKEARISKATSRDWPGFKYFCETYFPHVFTLGFTADHQLMFEEVEAATGLIGVTGYRGLGKTVILGIAYSIWCMILGEKYVIHTAADADLANERTAFTHHELSNNSRLLQDFPFLKPTDEATEDFYLKNHTRIRARGIKQAHRGTINPRTAKRPGLIICDDIDLEANQGNQSIGKRKLEKISQELSGALDPAHPGKVIWLGNLVHPNYAIVQYLKSIEEELKREGTPTGTPISESASERDADLRIGESTSVIPAKAGTQGQLHPSTRDADLRIGECTAPLHPYTPAPLTKVLKAPQRTILRFSLENPDGTSAWPEQYPTAKLPALRKQYGPTGYQREMLGLPVIEGNVFKNDWFTYYSTLPEPPKFRRVWLYADPAWGEKGCFKGVIAIGYDGNRFYVLRVWIRQTENTKFFRYYYDAYQELDRIYRSKFRAACETTYGQARILADFDRWATDNGLPPISHRIKKIDNRENKNLRIERTETTIETAKVVFPQGQDTPTLVSQYLTYPDGYIDGPDACAGCLERFSEYDIGKNRVKVRRFKF